MHRLTNVAAVPEDIQLWQVDLDAPGRDDLLSADERIRANTYRFPIHRQRFVACRGALRQILGEQLQRAPEQIEFTCSSNGKPSLLNSDLHFNVAHTENIALIAIAPKPVGIDVEFIRRVEFELLAQNVFSPPELLAWRSIKPEAKAQAFYGLWTRKEALLKAIGCGITQHVQSVSVFFDNPAVPQIPRDLATKCHLHSFDLAPDYPAALAWTAT